MTKGEVLAFVKSIHEHEFEDTVMLHWLDEVEQRVACEIYDAMPGQQNAVSSAEDSLSVPSPYDKIYWTYLLAMIELAAGSADGYELMDGIFKETFGDYARFVQRLCGSSKGGKKGGESV